MKKEQYWSLPVSMATRVRASADYVIFTLEAGRQDFTNEMDMIK